jgi:uncharacterized protein (DUF427 family)
MPPDPGTRRPLPPGVVPIEPGVGQESVWDYPRPPRVEPVTARVRVVVGGRAIADTTRAVRVLETAGAPVYYLPAEDVRFDDLRANERTTTCEWKGRATYFDHDDGARRIGSVGWAYANPTPGYEILRDRVAFYAGRVDEAWVGDEAARPQPGGFYGGWVTDAIVGPIKGEPGSDWW